MTRRTHDQILVRGVHAPVMELDSESSSAYIRFSWAKVARTVERVSSGPFVAIDYDASNQVVGVELVGVKEFSITSLLAIADIKSAGMDLNNTRYVSPRIRQRDLVEA